MFSLRLPAALLLATAIPLVAQNATRLGNVTSTASVATNDTAIVIKDPTTQKAVRQIPFYLLFDSFGLPSVVDIGSTGTALIEDTGYGWDVRSLVAGTNIVFALTNDAITIHSTGPGSGGGASIGDGSVLTNINLTSSYGLLSASAIIQREVSGSITNLFYTHITNAVKSLQSGDEVLVYGNHEGIDAEDSYYSSDVSGALSADTYLYLRGLSNIVFRGMTPDAGIELSSYGHGFTLEATTNIAFYGLTFNGTTNGLDTEGIAAMINHRSPSGITNRLTIVEGCKIKTIPNQFISHCWSDGGRHSEKWIVRNNAGLPDHVIGVPVLPNSGLNDGSFVSGAPDHSVIEGNIFEGGLLYGVPVEFDGSGNTAHSNRVFGASKVVDNTFEGLYGSGIVVLGNNNNLIRDILIKGNTLAQHSSSWRNSEDALILIKGGTDILIQDNHTSAEASGHSDADARAGIATTTSSTLPAPMGNTNIVISGNVLIGGAWGVKHVLADKVAITGNTFDGQGSMNLWSWGNDVTISGNKFGSAGLVTAGAGAIYLWKNDTPIMDNYLIFGNTVQDDQSTPTSDFFLDVNPNGYTMTNVVEYGNRVGTLQSGATAYDWSTALRDAFSSYSPIKGHQTIRANDGSSGAPGLSFIDDTDTGLYREGTSVGLSIDSGVEYGFRTDGLTLRNDSFYGWWTNDLSVVDTYFLRDSFGAISARKTGGYSSLQADSFIGSGASLTALDADNISSGTVSHERGGLEADVSAYSGLAGINAGATVEVDTIAEFDTMLGLTGTADGTTFLRGDGAWATPSGSGDVTAASAFGTDNVLIRSDGTGKGVQSSGIGVSDTDGLTGIGIIDATGEIETANQFHIDHTTSGSFYIGQLPTGGQFMMTNSTEGVGIGIDGNGWDVHGILNVNAAVAGDSFTGSGSGLTALNASNLGSGTVPDGRLPAEVPLTDEANTFTGLQTFENAAATVHAHGNQSGAMNVSWSTNWHTITATGNLTITMTDDPASGIGVGRLIKITQDGVGGHTVSIDGSSVNVNTGATEETWIAASTTDGGTTTDISSGLIDSPGIADGSIDAVHLSADARETFTETLGAAHTLSISASTGEGYGSVHYITAAVDIDLPDATAGCSFILHVDFAGTISVVPDTAATGDTLRVDTIGDLDAGDEADSAGSRGDIIVVTYYGADKWFLSGNGIVDGGVAD